ncbi:hypothetical protein ACY2HL_004408 [Enterobacter roggenkampii]
MNKLVVLAETAIVSLEEIKHFKRSAMLRQGHSYESSSQGAQDFVSKLVRSSTGSIADGIVTWGYDVDMANIGISVKKYFDKQTGYLCFFDDGEPEIAVLYYTSPKQDYVNALYRLTTIYQ